MARKLRLQYPGAIYHVMNRGDRKESIYEDEGDREIFLRLLGEACLKSAWQAHAFCLMANHFHLVVETPQANLAAGMHWLLSAYTARFNRRHRRSGHLFSGRYKSLIVDGSGSGYLRTVCEYVHLNPVRAGLLRREQPLRDYRWSSVGEYLKPARRRLVWLRVDRVLGECGIHRDSAAGRRQFGRLLEQRREGEGWERWRSLRRGWCLGEAEFRRELLEQVLSGSGKQRDRGTMTESAHAQGTRIIAEELKRLGWGEGDLEQRRKADAEKIRIAQRLRRETLVTQDWIASRLFMGTVSNVAFCLARERRSH